MVEFAGRLLGTVILCAVVGSAMWAMDAPKWAVAGMVMTAALASDILHAIRKAQP